MDCAIWGINVTATGESISSARIVANCSGVRRVSVCYSFR